MEVSPFGLSKVRSREEMVFPGRRSGFHMLGSSNQDQMDKPHLGKEIKPVLPTPGKARLDRKNGLTL